MLISNKESSIKTLQHKAAKSHDLICILSRRKNYKTIKFIPKLDMQICRLLLYLAGEMDYRDTMAIKHSEELTRTVTKWKSETNTTYIRTLKKKFLGHKKTIFGLSRQFLVFYISVPSIHPIVLFSAACSLVNFNSPQLPVFF
jgi:hypothetical protein